MVKPHIDPVTLEIACPTCQQSQFAVFRRDPKPPGRSLSHCKCICGQLFVYHVDDCNQPLLESATAVAKLPRGYWTINSGPREIR